VLCDVAPLASLDDRDYRSGLAEVAKYALTLDVELLAELERDPGPVLARDPGHLERLVARCVRAKARVVAIDERDHGLRLVLNYGHTLGHALERLEGFAGRTHGEAIAIGMLFAARLAEAQGMAAGADLSGRTARLLSSLCLGVGGSLPPVGRIMEAFRMDKKWAAGVRFVLLEDIGRPVVVDDVPPDRVEGVLRAMGVLG
jgi:3-dehydroquinate synthetase